MATQLDFFGDPGVEPPDDAVDPILQNVPADIRRQFEVLDGGAAASNLPPGAVDAFFGDPARPPAPPPRLSAQQKFVQNLGKKGLRVTVEGFNFQALDLTVEADRQEYLRIRSEVFPRAQERPEDWHYREESIPVLIDPQSPRGFRVVRLVEYARVDYREVTEGADFTILPRRPEPGGVPVATVDPATA